MRLLKASPNRDRLDMDMDWKRRGIVNEVECKSQRRNLYYLCMQMKESRERGRGMFMNEGEFCGD